MKRYWFQQIHILVASGIFVAVLALSYLIVSRHNRRIDLTHNKVHSLSPETARILHRMRKDKITVRAFFAEDDPAKRDLEVFLKEVSTHHPHFKYGFWDPDRYPSEARQYRIDTYQTTIIEYQKRQERIQDLSEESFANAFLRLAQPQKRTVCFTTGHGEIELANTERTGLAQWKQVLEDRQYEVREIELLPDGVPAECRSLIMAGPRYELLPKELDILQRYPGTGKGFLLLIDPMDAGTGKSYIELVKPFGIRLRDDVVIDKMSQVFGGDYLVPLITQYADHPVTKQFRIATFLPIARTASRIPDAPQSQLDVKELALTAPGSWAETDLKKLESGEAELNPDTDFVGPVSVAVASELKKGFKGARVVVVGDSDFITNAHLQVSGNRDFALNILQWLIHDEHWISIQGREPRFEPLFIHLNQTIGVAGFAIGVLPLTVLAVGSTQIWFRRRRSQ